MVILWCKEKRKKTREFRISPFPGKKLLSISTATGESAIRPWARIWYDFTPCWSKPKDIRMAISSNWVKSCLLKFVDCWVPKSTILVTYV
jgi:hypothetical protein